MTIEERPDEEPGGIESDITRSTSKLRRSFSKLRRELTDDEVAAPAVQRLLLDELDRLEREADSMGSFRDRYYAASEERAILRERLNQRIGAEILYTVCLTVGAASLGYAPAVWAHQPTGYLAIALGVILITGGILARARQR